MTLAESPPEQGLENTGLDRAAVFLSGLCLLHCLAIPFALMLGPLMGQWLVTSETRVHWILLALAVPISALALWRGFARHHNRLTVGLGAGGLLLMFIGVSHVLGENWEIALTVVGVCALLAAHVRNMMSGHNHA
jgi:hypothetical protein